MEAVAAREAVLSRAETGSVGFEVITLAGDALPRLIHRIEKIAGKLQDYAPDDFIKSNVEIVKQFHQMPEWVEVLRDNQEVVRETVGNPLCYQREPYMRILRTGHPEDSVGIHRDTHYGASMGEWVLWVPMTDGTDGAELRMIPGSHLEPESAYPWVQEQGVERYSDQHWLGFMWAPKRMSKEVEDSCVPIPCRVGEAILFNTNAVHGIKVNKAPWTRWSFDIRVSPQSEVDKRSARKEMFAQI